MASPTIHTLCCVCASPAELQCSACARVGPKLYFCSPEHQKLVWFAHKPICGPGKALLQILPEMSPAELEICKMPAFQQRLAHPSGGRNFHLRMAYAECQLLLPPGSCAQHAPHLTEWLSTQPQPQREAIRSTFADCINEFVRLPSSPVSWLRSLPPWMFALSFECWLSEYIPGLSSTERIQLCHRTAIWAGVLHVLVRDDAPDPSSSRTAEIVRLVAGGTWYLLPSVCAHPVKRPQEAADSLAALFSGILAAVPAMAGYRLAVTLNPDKPDYLIMPKGLVT